ncbi:BMP family ABC transporter substrate-binding protein [Streptomyces luteoverticillatus]|uniref:BMP family ABC transporter substrate-binding protein n=1 Tax=Streptomyces luteoverticillatus TaxID=66425 RepID=A0A3S9PDU7_STRLT|nr:BMP family ABC transporter substrate-binding protein [Streptomyces luteoverticillatus]AZQ70521.1 BMP family ABC transporter substrate-binding protein [Streptomyces luteoverticillatus]
MRRTSWLAAGAGAVVLVGGVIAAVLLSGDDDEAPAPRARQYSAHSACLLTDEHGVTGSEAASVWAGMEDASLATKAKVMNLPVFGPDTTANAVPYVNTLVQRHCDVVIAVGGTPVAATRDVAGRTPKTRFAVVGEGDTKGNLTVIPQAEGVRAAVARVVKDAVEDDGGVTD